MSNKKKDNTASDTTNESLDLGINKILNGQFPEYNFAQKKEIVEIKPLRLQSDDDYEDDVEIEDPNRNKFEELYQDRHWLDLLKLCNKELSLDQTNIQARLYWFDASLERKEIPSRIIAISLQDVYVENRIEINNDEILSKLFIRTANKLARANKRTNPASSLALYKIIYQMDPEHSCISGFKSFINERLQKLDAQVLTAAEHDPIHQEYDIYETWKKTLGSDESIKDESLQYTKRSVVPLLLVFLFLCVLSYYFYFSPEKKIQISLTEYKSAELNVPQVKLSIAPPRFSIQPIKLSADFRDVIKQIDATRPTSSRVPDQSARQRNNQPVVHTNSNRLDLSGPKEPAILKDIITGNTKGQSYNTNGDRTAANNQRTQANYDRGRGDAIYQDYRSKGDRSQDERPQNIVGDSHKRPIVSGQAIPGVNANGIRGGGNGYYGGSTRGGSVNSSIRSRNNGTSTANNPAYVVGKIHTETSLYILPDDAEAELDILVPADEVTVIESSQGWLKVITQKGVVGYVKSDKVN